jgi:hypothetical protein
VGSISQHSEWKLCVINMLQAYHGHNHPISCCRRRR